MNIPANVLIIIIGGLCAINVLISNAQKRSKARTFGLWFNGVALVAIAVALIIARIVI